MIPACMSSHVVAFRFSHAAMHVLCTHRLLQLDSKMFMLIQFWVTCVGRVKFGAQAQDVERVPLALGMIVPVHASSLH